MKKCVFTYDLDIPAPVTGLRSDHDLVQGRVLCYPNIRPYKKWWTSSLSQCLASLRNSIRLEDGGGGGSGDGGCGCGDGGGDGDGDGGGGGGGDGGGGGGGGGDGGGGSSIASLHHHKVIGILGCHVVTQTSLRM